MKKVLSIVLILVMVLAFAGCGKSGPGSTAQMLNYNDCNYYVCGHGEKEILRQYDIQELSANSCGELICYLKLSDNQKDFVVSRDKTDIELHEFASSLNGDCNEHKIYIIASNAKGDAAYLAAVPQLHIAD